MLHRRDIDAPNVIVLDEPWQASLRATRASGAASFRAPRPRLVSVALIAGLIGLHLAAFELIGHSKAMFMRRPTALEPAVTAYILPKIRDGGGADVINLSTLVVQWNQHFSDLHIEQPQFEFEAARNAQASSAAPTLIGRTQIDMSAYVREAALRSGEGVTVVLRIEVLEDGSPGRILVDTSGGSRQIDDAAIDYARTRRWNAGRIDGASHVVWIRWGVRLQA
jgi:TonB family protein